MLKEQVEELRALNKELADVVVAEQAQVKALLDELKGLAASLQATVDDLKAKLAEIEGIDLTNDLANLQAVKDGITNLAENASA